jgi:hypothetical protein
MRRKYSRIVAITLAAVAGGLAAFALRPAAGTSTAMLAARNPAVEVRTQVIRRTIHVIRHESGAGLRGAHGSSALVIAGHGGTARTASSAGHRTPHAGGTAASATRASGAHGSNSAHSTVSAAPVATRSSGSHSTSSAPVSQSHPVSTRSSGSHGTSSGAVSGTSSRRPVSTRSSGSHGTSSAGSPGRPVTRSSGGAHRDGGDGGDGNGGDN